MKEKEFATSLVNVINEFTDVSLVDVKRITSITILKTLGSMNYISDPKEFVKMNQYYKAVLNEIENL